MYENGITHTTSRSRGSGIGLGAGGIGFGVGGAKTQGIHVNATAQRVAPSRKQRVGWPITISVIAFFVFLVSVTSSIPTALISLLVAGIAGFISYQRITWNRNVFPSLADRWSRSYLCNRCGTMMIPVVAQPTPVSSQAPPAVDTIEQLPELPN